MMQYDGKASHEYVLRICFQQKPVWEKNVLSKNLYHRHWQDQRDFGDYEERTVPVFYTVELNLKLVEQYDS